jgi:hypothetical protein
MFSAVKKPPTTHYLYDPSDQRVQMDVKKGAAATTSTKFFNQYYEVAHKIGVRYLFLLYSTTTFPFL